MDRSTIKVSVIGLAFFETVDVGGIIHSFWVLERSELGLILSGESRLGFVSFTKVEDWIEGFNFGWVNRGEVVDEILGGPAGGAVACLFRRILDAGGVVV